LANGQIWRSAQRVALIAIYAARCASTLYKHAVQARCIVTKAHKSDLHAISFSSDSLVQLGAQQVICTGIGAGLFLK